ncbi:MAG: hypothetical protein CVT63_08355 [Candidatus Anoxymicrobium japonicum]|uniref:Uncharacterized protein n=1 Tax=Candidatus Anoxymicrobium japonicum TaxID=2013648 RepID=A0A2N3G1M8_9ACTN|nr:MAG: hypothetical protein CVT63_08355 [Candidatus Anoxymicrobium japonicum]
MTAGMISLAVPEPLYRRLERVAQMTQRSVAETLASAIAIAVPSAADLPDALADELAGMAWLSDKMLRSAIRPTFTRTQQKRLAEINDIQDKRPLSVSERAEQAHLLAEYERSMLRRAQAFMILAQRGYRTPGYNELASNL